MGALAIFDLIEGFLDAAWRVVTTPPWSYLALAALVALGIWGSGQLGYRRGEADCRAAHAAAVARVVTRVETVVRTVVQRSDASTAQHATEDASNKATVRTIYVHDKALPGAAAVCVGPDDADRLRGLH